MLTLGDFGARPELHGHGSLWVTPSDHAPHSRHLKRLSPPSDFGFWLRFDSAPVLTHKRTFRPGAHQTRYLIESDTRDRASARSRDNGPQPRGACSQVGDLFGHTAASFKGLNAPASMRPTIAAMSGAGGRSALRRETTLRTSSCTRSTPAPERRGR